MDKKYILFDLDGTLTDNKAGITHAAQIALKHFGIEVEDLNTLCKFIGPPLRGAFMEYYGFTEIQAEEAAAVYREYFAKEGLFENTVYPGIQSMLQTLNENGKILILATSKPEIFAKQIMEHFNLAKYFFYMAGGTMDNSRVKKGDVIAYALKNCQITDLSQVVMVGDRLHDMIGAKDQGVDAIGVLYGYGSEEELLHHGAKVLAATPEAVTKILIC